MSERVRTFVAIELPEEVRAHLAAQQEALARAGGEVRWVRVENIHLTLVFLGAVAAERLGEVAEAVRRATEGAGRIRLGVGGAGQFPPRGRPRVVWTAVEEPTGALERLQKRMAEATAAFAEKVEDRAYSPHLTLGRVRSPGAPGSEALSAAIAESAERTGPEFEASEVVVFQSDLGPEGPAYTALARVALGQE
ncbi:MAG: RNA 2',3'-cyclic phosphodiesterase [Phycisphaerae bacterium]|nr:RNA 2',3'-cyclic phosphodiesterase [Phycisphaerae bacterium]